MLFAALGAMLCLAACNIRRPSMVLSNDKMAEVLYDYHVAQAMIRDRSISSDDEKQAYMDFVFQKHGVAEEAFDSSLAWFSQHPKEMSVVYDQLFARMNRSNDELKQRIAERDNRITEAMQGDSVDLWPNRKVMRLSSKTFERLITFDITADQYYQDKDTFRWRADFHFINGRPAEQQGVVMAMQAWYDKDSLISALQWVNDDGTQLLTLQNDTLGKIKHVQGFIYYPRQDDSTKWVLLNHISLLRLHGEQETIEAAPDTLTSSRALRVRTVEAAADTTSE